MKVIYAIINLQNGKKYIGSTTNFSRRKREHLNDLKKGKHHSISLQRSWNKNTEEDYKFIILEHVEDNTKLLEREQHFLNKYLSFEKDKGYNICKFVGLPPEKKLPEVFQYTLKGEFVQKFKDCVEAANYIECSSSGIASCCREEYRYYKGFIWTYEKELTEERIRLANSPVKRTEESKKKMSESAKKRTDNLKPILQYDLEGNFIREWESTSHLVKEKGYSNGSISDCLNGRWKKAYGFIWKFKNETDKTNKYC